MECDSWMIDQPLFLLAFQHVQPPNTPLTGQAFSLHICCGCGISPNLIVKLVVHVNAFECVA